ncbi:MAG TPA: tail fiber domain-containing protein, partial [Hymenobacter sp.]|nr:tail fiber domain-containing protein [Hymenobacter sp.]
LANGSITANRLVGVDQNGNLVPTTATLSPGLGFVENRVHVGSITSPAGQQGSFDLDGTGYLGGSLTTAASVVAGASVNAGANLTANADLVVGATGRFGTNVGIGLTSTTAPLSERLTVNGNIVPEGSGLGTLGTSGAFGLRWNSLFVENSFIGIPNPGASATDRLTVNGNILPFVNGGSNLGSSSQRWNTLFATNVVNVSDARLKTNISGVGYGLDAVLAMRPVRYAWKKSPNQINQLGFLAQEMQKVVPEVVNEGDDANHTMGINYVALVPVLVKALQEQQAQLDAMRGRAEKAEAAVQSFESRLRALEAGSTVNATAQGQR